MVSNVFCKSIKLAETSGTCAEKMTGVGPNSKLSLLPNSMSVFNQIIQFYIIKTSYVIKNCLHRLIQFCKQAARMFFNKARYNIIRFEFSIIVYVHQILSCVALCAHC